jgi:CheY-like chemotaxis protein
MSLPFFHTPGTVVFVDDDLDYLESLALVLPAPWAVRLFVRPHDAVAALRADAAAWEADAQAQQHIVDQWRRQGTPLVPQLLAYWQQHTQRHALVQVAAVDYSMPGMDGLQALEAFGDWPGMRMLLTGQADEQIAIRAFNEGWIQHYCPKQSLDMGARLVQTVQRLQIQAANRQAPVWRSTLTPFQASLLRAPGVMAALAQMVQARFVEYALIGEPFGLIGRDAQGRPGWLQLEPASGLDDLADLADDQGASGFGGLNDVREGRELINVDLLRSLGSADRPRMRTAHELGSDGALLAAWFELPAPYSDAPTGYAHWLAQQPAREVVL